MFSDESFDVVGFPSCWKTERYNFPAPPSRVGDGLHLVVSAHYGNSSRFRTMCAGKTVFKSCLVF